MSGLALMAAIAAAVAMKPSMMTRRLDVAACRMAAAIIAISKPPYSVKAVAASSWDAVRSADLVRTASLCWTPSELSPVPGPTRSDNGMLRILWAMIAGRCCVGDSDFAEADGVGCVEPPLNLPLRGGGEKVSLPLRKGREKVSAVFSREVVLGFGHRGADAEIRGAAAYASVDEVGMVDGVAFYAGVDDLDRGCRGIWR